MMIQRYPEAGSLVVQEPIVHRRKQVGFGVAVWAVSTGGRAPMRTSGRSRGRGKPETVARTHTGSGKQDNHN